MKFNEFNLHEKLLKGIDKAGYKECLPVQEETLKITLKGKDVFVQSQTGTGKTAAFLVSIFQKFLSDPGKYRKALVIAPTRELAVQIEKEAKLLSSFLDYKIASFYGGVGYDVQEKDIEKGVDLYIGTPGRLIDFGDKRKIDFRKIDILVIDEADRLFDMGFLPDIKRMLSDMPRVTERTTMLFSATLNHEVRQLAWKYMNEPESVEIEPEKVTVDKITQVLYHVGKNKKMSLLLGLLKQEDSDSVLIFTNTRQGACEISSRLEYNGYTCGYISGDLPQNKRLKIINDIKTGKIKYLIATDVAARGLHIDNLGLVINYDLPEDAENYVHRIGRTARVGNSGRAISLACEKFVYGLEAIEKYIGMKLQVEWPDDTLFIKDESFGKFFIHDNEKSDSGRKKRVSRPPKSHSIVKRTEAKKKPGKQRSLEKPQHKRQLPHTSAGAPYGNKKRIEAKFPHPKPERPRQKPVTLDERLAYYREKYGEDFKPIGETVKKENKKVSIFGKIKSIFFK